MAQPKKRCRRCKKELPLRSAFYRRDASPDGFQNICKECNGFRKRTGALVGHFPISGAVEATIEDEIKQAFARLDKP